jgi:hypothetical protein
VNPPTPVSHQPKYKLLYFNVRAKAEIIRWIFAVAGQEYEDCRLDDSAWAELKPSEYFCDTIKCANYFKCKQQGSWPKQFRRQKIS